MKQSLVLTVVDPKLGVLGCNTDGLGGFDTQVGVGRAPEVSLARTQVMSWRYHKSFVDQTYRCVSRET